MKTPRLLCVFLCLALLAALGGCFGPPKPENRPYEPDTPAPPPMSGTFAAEGSSMTFNGDGSTILLDLTPEFARRAGLPEGHSEGTYAFTQDLPPYGHVSVRYDTAHTLVITLGEGEERQETVLDIGYASEDGASATVYIGAVTDQRIPILFTEEKHETVMFSRTDGDGT
jgi:hypothetical protein